jgi:polysaccharide export outer membrane protein
MGRYICCLLSSLVLFLIGCSNPSYHAYRNSGPEEFIMDSYKIRQGKYSILEMEGKSLTKLSSELLNEKEPVIQEQEIFSSAFWMKSCLSSKKLHAFSCNTYIGRTS